MSDQYEISETDVAIVGMAARVPGARDVGQFWENLKNGVESIRHFSDEELLAAGEDPEQLRRKNYVRACAPLEDMEAFDAEFWGFSPKDAAILDPQHRHFLECCWEALEHAGHPPERFEGPIGVFGGCGQGSYLYFNLCTHPSLVREVGMFLLRHTGNDKDFLTTRVSYLLDLKGPSVNIVTACSTSLVAVHTASQSLLSHECDLALAGGVTILLPHRRGYIYEEGEILSPDGHCHAFDHRAQGTVFGSGCAVLVLRRLDDAIEDGDVIHGVIRGSAVNNDGAAKVNYLAPSVDGQAACMVEAYAVGDVDPRTIEYVECHGTGTYLGDPIEIEALTQAFRTSTQDRNFCRVGSVKTNIGHLDTAAGAASLIKAVLALKHCAIPPSLGFEEPNPAIDFASSPFSVAHELTPWPAPARHPRRAAVNSLGVGGTNAHVVVQEPPPRPPSSDATRPVQLVSLSAASMRSLDAASRRLAAHLRAHPEQSLADVCWTLRHGRRAFDKRRVVAASSSTEAARLLEEGDPRRVFTHTASERATLVFLLPGGGSHYPGMAAGLYQTERVFREHLDHGLDLLESEHGIDLRSRLISSPEDAAAAAELDRMPYQLPAIFITSVAMAKLFESWGVTASVLLGHSLGENTAACLAGVMSFEDCLGLVVLRGRLFEKAPDGAMLAIDLSADRVRGMLGRELDLAVVNAPESTVVSGPTSAIVRLAETLEQLDQVHTRRLAIPTAAHSRLLDPILDEFAAYLSSIRLNRPTRRFLSNTTGTWITDEQATSPTYWVNHLRSTVRFAKNVETVLATGPRVLVECGPGHTLNSLVRQHPAFRAGSHQTVSSIRHREEVTGRTIESRAIEDQAFFTTALGRVWASGCDFDWEALWPGEVRHRVELPTYAWNHKRYFLDPAPAQPGDREVDVPRAPDVEDFGWETAWKPALADPRELTEPHTWLLFMDQAGVGRRLRDLLRRHRQRVIAVYEGDAYGPRGQDEYSLRPEGGKEPYTALVADLVAEGTVPDRIVHLWLLESEPSVRPGSSRFHHHQERGFFSLFFLAQALAQESLPPPIHLTVVENGLAKVEADDAVRFPDKATILGPVKVVPRELEGVTACVVDVHLPEHRSRLFGGTVRTALLDPFGGKKRVEAELDRLVSRLMEELTSPPRNAFVALRPERRYEQVVRPAKLPALMQEIPGPLREGGVYLLTGGLGGLGLTMAELFARTARAKLVLLSRHSIPPRAHWAEWMRKHGGEDRISQRLRRLLEVEEAGGEVMVVAADVTNLEEMREVMRSAEERFGAIHGVLHMAGTVRDELIALKTHAEVEDVFTPKIQGTMVLDELFQEKPLDFFVLFSSTSTHSAPAGQVDYVAANAFLDAFAESRSDGPTRTIAVDWGIWNRVGMTAQAADHGRLTRAGERVGEQPDHPLLDARVRDLRGETVLRAIISPARHWVLDGHRTRAGHPLLVGTAFLEFANAALRAYGETGPFEIEDLFFIRPVSVPDGTERELRIALRPTPRGYNLEVRSRIETDGGVGWELHAQAHLALHPMTVPPDLPLAKLVSRLGERGLDEDSSGLRTPQERHLTFGPRWRTLRRTAFGSGEALGHLALDDAYAHETASYHLHPALLDIATGWAMDLIRDYRADSLWVPVSYERVRVYRDLPARIVSWVRNAADNHDDAEFAFFDVTIADEKGRILLEVDKLTLRKVAGEIDFTMRARPASTAVEMEADASAEREPSPAERQLLRNLERGILPAEGQEALLRVLAGPPRARWIISSLDVSALIEQAARALRSSDDGGLQLARPDLDNDYVEARDDVERTLVGFWQELLGVQSIGVHDSFFDLGGHSLIAVRLFAKVKKAFNVEFPISVLFEAPTIERCAELIRQRSVDRGRGTSSERPSSSTRYTHLVPMHPGEGGPKTPFFLVAGMFGNVLNLRHLANLLGTDRRFYGLQARGLYGDQKPHERFEEMAEAYLEEVRRVQPVGPYFLGGFSGGGITAYEMAQQLRREGQEVGLLVMLDTPMRFHKAPLSLSDRIKIQRQELERKGIGYLGEWAVNRWNWETARLRRYFEQAEPDRTVDQFHDEAIERAFHRALSRYTVQPWPGVITMFRPPMQVAYDLGKGRLLDKNRDYVEFDNGWSPLVERVDVYEVPGDHDSMVLEPNVRVLARKLHRVVEEVEAKVRQPSLLEVDPTVCAAE